MKIIKIFMLFCAIFIFGENLKANDIVFESKGGHIVPMNMSNILSWKKGKEKMYLDMKCW